MNMLESFKKLFAKDTVPAPPPQAGEFGFYRSSIYGKGAFAPWNPDKLLINRGIEVYPNMMRDDQVKACMRCKQSAIISRKYFFDKNESAQHEEMAEFFEAMIDNMKGAFKDDMKGILSALPYGFSINEKMYGQMDFKGLAKWVIADIKLRPWDSIEFNVDGHGNVLNIYQRIGGQLIELPPDKVIHFVFQSDIDPIFGESDLRAAYKAWWSKDQIIKFWDIYLERHATGFWFIQTKAGITEKIIANLKNMLNHITLQSGMILPDTAEMNHSTPTNTQAFEAALVSKDKAIAKSLLMPNLMGLSEQGATGSYSQSKTQFEVFLWVLDDIASSVEDTLNEQLFRQVALWNYGTDDFPRFKFEPMSAEQVKELITIWKDLVAAGAVTQSSTDEAHIRGLLDFPEYQIDDTQAEQANPDSAFNGAQVMAMADIVARTASGEIPKETAIQILYQAFPLSVEDAKAMIDPIEIKEIEQAPSGGDVATGDQNNNDNDANGAPIPSTPNDDNEPEEGMPDNEEFVLSLDADKRKMYSEREWMRRIDFKKTDSIYNTAKDNVIASINPELAAIRLSLENQVSRLWGNGTKSGKGIKVGSELEVTVAKGAVSKIRNGFRIELGDVMDIGYKTAKAEAPKRFAKAIKAGQDKLKADKYVANGSYKIAGGLRDDIESSVRNIVSNGIKYDKTLNDIITDMEEDEKLNAMLPKVDSAGRAINVPARLETIARTSITDAYNQARLGFWTSPEMGGYVQAFEYSAILDDRTTDVCASLHGRVRRDWAELVPPNHFNCRSLLIPITEIDNWDGKQDNVPSSVNPHEGFG